MIPERVQRIALAALLHDLPALVQRADRVPAGARRVLELAEPLLAEYRNALTKDNPLPAD